MSNPRNSLKINWNDHISNNDEGLYDERSEVNMYELPATHEEIGNPEEPGHNLEDGNTPESGTDNTKGNDAVVIHVQKAHADARQGNATLDDVGQRDSSCSSYDSSDDKSENHSSEQPPGKPRERANARQITYPGNFDHPNDGRASPRQVISYALYRQTALEGGRNDRHRFEFKRKMISEHTWKSKLHKSASIDEIKEPHTFEVGLQELQAGEPPEIQTSPVSPEDEHGSPLSIWRISLDSPPNIGIPVDQMPPEGFGRRFVAGDGQRSGTDFRDVHVRETTAIERAGRPNRRQPPPRPHSAPPLELPSSCFSDDSDESDEQAEGSEDAKAEMQARKQEKEREWLEKLWGHSLGSQPLRPPVLDSGAEGILRAHRVYLQDQELRDSKRRKDRNYINSMGAHFRTVAEAKRFENVGQVIDYAVKEWKKNQVVIYSVWAKEKSIWARKEEEKEAKLKAELRAEWDEVCLRYSNMLIERDVTIKELQKNLKRLQRRYEDPNKKVESSRSQIHAAEEAKIIPKSKLSIIFGEATATSPISPSIVCSGGPDWVAPDAIDLVIPEAMTIASPVSPTESPQTPREEHHPQNITFSQKPELRLMINTTLEEPEPHIEESPASWPPALAPDFGQPCHCCGNDNGRCGCSCKPEAIVEADENRKKMERLEELNDELRDELEEREAYRQEMHKGKGSKRLEELKAQVVPLITRVQDMLIARDIEIMSIRRAIGMEGEKVTICPSDVKTKPIREFLIDWEKEKQRKRVRKEVRKRLKELVGGKRVSECVPIEGIPVEVSPEKLTPSLLRSRSLKPELLRSHLR